jgi:hypothetical protein
VVFLNKLRKPYKSNENTCTSIVVWGSIMGSGIYSSLKFTKIVRQMFTFTEYVFSVIIGIILSDGWLGIDQTWKKC